MSEDATGPINITHESSSLDKRIHFKPFNAGRYLRVPLIYIIFLWENSVNIGITGLKSMLI